MPLDAPELTPSGGLRRLPAARPADAGQFVLWGLWLATGAQVVVTLLLLWRWSVVDPRLRTTADPVATLFEAYLPFAIGIGAAAVGAVGLIAWGLWQLELHLAIFGEPRHSAWHAGLITLAFGVLSMSSPFAALRFIGGLLLPIGAWALLGPQLETRDRGPLILWVGSAMLIDSAREVVPPLLGPGRTLYLTTLVGSLAAAGLLWWLGTHVQRTLTCLEAERDRLEATIRLPDATDESDA